LSNNNVTYTLEVIREIVRNKGFELLSEEYKDNKTKLTLRDSDGYLYYAPLVSFTVKIRNPRRFDKNNIYTLYNINLWLSKTIPYFELISDKYIDSNTNLILKDKDGYLYTALLGNLLNNHIPYKFDVDNQYTLNNIRLFLKLNLNDFSLADETYKRKKHKITLHDKDGYYYQSFLKDLENGCLPQKFHSSNKFTINNINLWLKINNKNFELLSEKYIDNRHKLIWQCLSENCGEIFDMNLRDILYSNCGCPYCAGIRVGLSNCLATKNPELAKEWHPIKNGDITPYDVTCGSSRERYWWKCNKCKHEWKSNVLNRNNGTNCPKCNESKGEKQLDIILSKYNIHHDSQYAFGDLVGIKGGLLRFDSSVFWDEKMTQLRMLIEYDGEQHFRWIEGMMIKEEFETLQIHDQLKNKYCKNNNIKLLRIPYWDFNNIEKILMRELNN